MDRKSGPTAWAARFSNLNHFDFKLCWYLDCTAYAKKSFKYRTCNNEYRMDLRWYTWNFQESCSHCSDMQHPVLKLKVDTLRILFYRQETSNRKQCFQKGSVHKTFFVLLWCRFKFSRSGRASFFHSLCLLPPAFLKTGNLEFVNWQRNVLRNMGWIVGNYCAPYSVRFDILEVKKYRILIVIGSYRLPLPVAGVGGRLNGLLEYARAGSCELSDKITTWLQSWMLNKCTVYIMLKTTTYYETFLLDP